MSLPGEDLKNWIILPTIVSNEQESIDIVQMHRDIAEYAGKLKLPDVNLKQKKKSLQNVEVGKKQQKTHKNRPVRRIKSSTTEAPNDNKEILEFVNIVRNPPIRLKFLSSTEIRDSQQAKHEVCGRWLEHFEKSIKGKVENDDNEECSCAQTPDEDPFNLQDNDLLHDYYFSSDDSESLASIELRLLDSDEAEGRCQVKNENSDQFYENSEEEHLFNLISNISFGHCKNKPQITPLKERIEKVCNDCLVDTEKYPDNYDYLITRSIELEARQRRIKSLPNFGLYRQKRISPLLDHYQMTVDLREPPNSVESKKYGVQNKQVCERFELKSKSSLDTKRRLSNEDLLKARTVEVFPFYEIFWGNEIETQREPRSASKRETQSATTTINRLNKLERVKLTQESVEESLFEDLRISQIKMQGKGELGKPHLQAGIKKAVVDTSQGQDNSLAGNIVPELISEDDYEETSLCLRKSSLTNMFLNPESDLLRVAANADRLSDSELIRLIRNGQIDLNKFLIIKQLLPLYLKEWISSGRRKILPKDINARVQKLREFLERLEKLSCGLVDLLKKQNAAEDSQEKSEYSDLVVLGLSNRRRLEKIGEEDRSILDKKRVKCLRAKRLKRQYEISKEIQIEPRKISAHRSMFVNRLSLKENKRWKNSLPYNMRKFPRPGKNAGAQRRSKGKTNGCGRGLEDIDDESLVLLANPPSSRNSLVSSFDPMPSMLMSQYLPITGSDSRLSSNTLPQCESKEARKIRRKNSNLKKKLSVSLLNKIHANLASNLQLYPRIQNLLSMLNSKGNSTADIKAARDTKIDHTAHFKLVDKNRLEMYCQAFAKVDQRGNGEIPIENIGRALRFVDSLVSVPEKYIEYTLLILDIGLLSRITIKMFCVICTILERMMDGGLLIREAMESLNLVVSQGKMIWYKQMFYDAIDFDRNFINLETVKLELFAGGMNSKEGHEVTERITTEDQMISFMDFVAYIPLFISIHDKICANTFNMKF